MAYNSAYTGAQIDGAVSTVRSNAEGWSNKQNAITASGVLKGDGAGNVTAADSPREAVELIMGYRQQNLPLTGVDGGAITILKQN